MTPFGYFAKTQRKRAVAVAREAGAGPRGLAIRPVLKKPARLSNRTNSAWRRYVGTSFLVSRKGPAVAIPVKRILPLSIETWRNVGRDSGSRLVSSWEWKPPIHLPLLPSKLEPPTQPRSRSPRKKVAATGQAIPLCLEEVPRVRVAGIKKAA